MGGIIEFITSGYSVHLAILICLYLILAQSLNLSFGLGRLLNLAHVSFYALGAYATALLSVEHGLGFFPCIAASVGIAMLFAVVIGGISLRLSHDYFAIGTLAMSSLVTALLINWRSLTRGVLGIPGIPRPELWGVNGSENEPFLLLMILLAALSLVVLNVLFSGRLSRALRAQAESEIHAAGIGINVPTVRIEAFIISAGFAGMGGALYAYYINYIDPTSFSLTEMVFLLSIVIVGRPGNFWGVVASTVFLVLLPEPLRFLELPSSILGPMRQLLYAVFLFAVVYSTRKTLFPAERKV